MPLRTLRYVLERDHALRFAEDGGPLRGEGWAWSMADVMTVLSDDCDFMALYRSKPAYCADETDFGNDLKDLRILARRAGYRVESYTNDNVNCTVFLGPFSDWDEELDEVITWPRR